MDHRTFLETWFRRVWEEEDLSAIAEMFQPDAVARGLADEAQVGPREFSVFAGAMLELVTDAHATILRCISDGDWVAAVISITAKGRDDGRDICFTAETMARIRDGKITESYNHFDSLGLFEQLGLLPRDTFLLCLSGEALGGA